MSNVVKNDLVKKTDFSADNYVKKTKFTALDDKIDKVDKKFPDISESATKSSVTTLVRQVKTK